MKTKTLLMVLMLFAAVVPVSSCHTVNEGSPASVPQITSSHATASASQPGPTDPVELEQFLDLVLAEQMSALHVPGAIFVLVKDGAVLFAKGYGYADLETRTRYDPDTTVFWAASVAKAFTTVGVLQLYERGSIDLDSGVNRYLEDLQIPNGYATPLTVAHLLTHTDDLAWYGAPVPHLAVLLVATLLFLGTPIAWSLGAWLCSRRGGRAGASSAWRLARWLAAAICALHLLFVTGVALVTANPFELVYGIPPLLHITLALALLAVMMTVGLPILTVLSWKNGYGSWWGRVHYTLLTVVALAFTWWLDYWNLLGFPYGG